MSALSALVLTIPSGQNTSNEVTFSGAGGVYPSSIITPQTTTGATIFRLQRAITENGAIRWKTVRFPGSGGDNPVTLAGDTHIPIDTDTVRSLKNKRIRIVSATNVSQNTAFVLEYEQI